MNSQKGDAMADTPDASIEDVSLLETPIGGPPAPDEPSTPAADDKPDDGAGTQDKPSDDKPDEPDAKATEATTDTDEGDKPDEDQNADDKPDQPKTPEEERAERDRLAAQAWQQRQRTRSQVAQQLDQTYGPKTEEELIEEGVPAADAKVEALRQEMQYNQQRAAIAELNAGMQSDAVNVINDFPVFNAKSPEYDADFAAQVQQAYQTAARLQHNDDGIVLNAEVPLYDFYKQMADIYSRGAAKGSEQGQLDAMQVMSRTETPGGSSSAGSSGDSLEEMEERLGNVRIA